MTTIAVNKDSIACDLQMTYRDAVKLKCVTKILEVPEDACDEVFKMKRCLIGFSGNADIWGEVVSWFHDRSEKPPRCKGIEFLMLNDRREIYHATNLRNWMLLPQKHFAIGSGMQFAIAAMESGKTPIEACKIASKYDPNTGMGYKEYKL